MNILSRILNIKIKKRHIVTPFFLLLFFLIGSHIYDGLISWQSATSYLDRMQNMSDGQIQELRRNQPWSFFLLNGNELDVSPDGRVIILNKREGYIFLPRYEGDFIIDGSAWYLRELQERMHVVGGHGGIDHNEEWNLLQEHLKEAVHFGDNGVDASFCSFVVHVFPIYLCIYGKMIVYQLTDSILPVVLLILLVLFICRSLRKSKKD